MTYKEITYLTLMILSSTSTEQTNFQSTREDGQLPNVCITCSCNCPATESISADTPSLLSSSSFFTFIVGNNRKPVVVPDNLFEDVSDVLNNKIHGAMKEGIEKQSEINDIDWEVFVGLCEYAYTKDYYDTLPFGEESEEVGTSSYR